MTKAQTCLYFREWGKARKALLKAHYEPKEADARRLEIHAEVLGIENFDPTLKPHRSAVSSKRLNNATLDKVLAAFRAISDSSNLKAQIDADNQPLKRATAALRHLQARMLATNDYVDGIAHSMFRRALKHCTLNQVKKVIAALNTHRLRSIKVQRERVYEIAASLGKSMGEIKHGSFGESGKTFLQLEAHELCDLYNRFADEAWQAKLESER